MPIQNKDTLAASVPTPPVGSTMIFTDSGQLKVKNDAGSVAVAGTGTVTSVNVSANNGITVSGNPITTSGTLTLGLGAISPTGNLTLADNTKITGDFTDHLTRPHFQTNIPNADTFVDITPNGTGRAGLLVENTNNYINNAYLFLGVLPSSPADMGVITGVRGAGTPLSLKLGANGIVGVEINTTGNTYISKELILGATAGTPGITFQNASHIEGPFSGPVASRPHFMTNATNSPTILTVMANGVTSLVSGISVFQIENDLNSSFAVYGIDSTHVSITSGANGAGTVLPVKFFVGTIAAMEITPLGNVIIGEQNILPPTATDGYVYLQTASGTPTGTPTTYTGAAPQVIDLGNNKFYFYTNGSWRNTNTPDYEEFVATALQTVFNTAIPTKAKLGTKSFLQVFVNGVFQQQGATKQYNVTGANQITFNAGVALNSDVVIYGYA
jgi:hypothetical protein